MWLQVVRSTPGVYRAHAATLLPLSLILLGPVYLVLRLFAGQAVRGVAIAGEGGTDELCATLGSGSATIATALLSGLLYAVLAGAATVAVLRPDLPPGATVGPVAALGPARALGETGRRLRPLLGATVLGAAVVAVLLALPLATLGFVQGCYAVGGSAEAIAAWRQALEASGAARAGRTLTWASLVVGMVYVLHAGVKWVVAPQVAIVEGGTARSVLWRSRNLVKGRWFGVAGTLALIAIMQSVFAALLGLPAALIPAAVPGPLAGLVAALLGTLAQVAALPIGAVASVLLYDALRPRAAGVP